MLGLFLLAAARVFVIIWGKFLGVIFLPTQELIEKFCHDNTICDFLGVEVRPAEGGVRLELEVSARHSNCYDILHGGVMTTMADTAMGAACFARNKKVVTVSMTLEFMHAVALGTRIFTDAKILHDGHQIMICECGIVDAAGNLYAKAHATFFVIETLES